MKLVSWITPSLQRIFPATRPLGSATVPELNVACNERFSFQAAVRNDGEAPVQVDVSVTTESACKVRVRRVGYVPVRHINTLLPANDCDVEGRDQIPGFVPDPLFEETSHLIPAQETHAFWLTVTPESALPAGRHTLAVTLQPKEGEPVTHSVEFTVHPVLLERPRFSMTHWIYLDALMDWYGTEGFDEEFWKILPAYLRNMAEHGLDTLFTPVFTPPLDGVKRPTQLLRVEKVREGEYRFDWSLVSRYIALGRECGFQTFEWSHLFTQWGAKNALRIYPGHGEEEIPLWEPETPGDSPVYRRFLEQFLPSFHEFLISCDLLESSAFHISDEPHGDEAFESYAKAKEIIRSIAPWMKPLMEAISEYRPDRKDLIEIPIPSVSSALEFLDKGMEPWCYYCCIPRGAFINRFLDTPLAKVAMHGFLFYRWPFRGFLHWGYNYWYQCQTRNLIDPFTVQDAQNWPEWAYGDPFVVYPGKDGPIDSIRWEVFGESLQDYALLQTLAIDRDHRLLQPIESFESFPKNTDWRLDVRRALFEAVTGT